MRMDNRKLIHSGDIYSPEDPAILAEQTQAMLPMYEYNQTLPTEGKKRQTLLKKCLRKLAKIVISNRHFMQIEVVTTLNLVTMSTQILTLQFLMIPM